MEIEIKVLAWAAVLLLVHIFVAVGAKTKQYGSEWNMGARDETMPPLNPIAGRLERARDNFLETLPIALIAFIGVVLAEKTSATTAMGAWIWLGARALYLVVYWAGIPKIRTLIYFVSLAGLGMGLFPLLAG